MRISNFSSMCHFFLISRGRARQLHLNVIFCRRITLRQLSFCLCTGEVDGLDFGERHDLFTPSFPLEKFTCVVAHLV